MRSTSADGEGCDDEAETKAGKQRRRPKVRAKSGKEDFALEGAIVNESLLGWWS